MPYQDLETMARSPKVATPAYNGDDTSIDAVHDERNCGYDNCKSIFMMLVVLWHTAHLYILEATVTSTENSVNFETTGSLSWFDRASHGHLHHHHGWTPLISHMVIRYWLWTEKVAVPGFCFLSGYFSKGFLRTKGSNSVALDLDKKERDRWQKTLSTLLVGPLLWQVLTAAIGYSVSLLYFYHHSSDTNRSIDSGLPPYLSVFENLGTWYLFALLIWRTWTSVILSRLKQSEGLILALSIAMALLSAHTDRGNGPQDMRMRLFFFFPYYVAGLYTDESTWQRITVPVRWCLSPHECHRNSPRYMSWFSCCLRKHRQITLYQRKGHDILPSTAPSPNFLSENLTEQACNTDTMSRILGFCGVAFTLAICQIMNQDDLGWMYSIGSYELRPHLMFLFQYLLAGTAVMSVILIFKTIRDPLFPFSHGHSTLAIYEWHWPIANLLAWGSLPFTDIHVLGVTNMASTGDDSLVQYVFANCSPLSAVLMVHVVCYSVCVLLGSRILWRIGLRFVCDPNCQWLFA